MESEIQAKFSTFPVEAQRQLESVRRLIFSVAEENDLGAGEETLKWGEASYLVKGGSTIRIDWKPKDPGAVKVYFHCQTRLVETFREIYQDEFEYEGKRAMVIPLSARIEEEALSHCYRIGTEIPQLETPAIAWSLRRGKHVTKPSNSLPAVADARKLVPFMAALGSKREVSPAMAELLEFETERLRLRQWQESDLEPFAALNVDPQVMEFFPESLGRQASLL